MLIIADGTELVELIVKFQSVLTSSRQQSLVSSFNLFKATKRQLQLREIKVYLVCSHWLLVTVVMEVLRSF